MKNKGFTPPLVEKFRSFERGAGFTLIEMMAVVFISMIIFATMFGLFLMGRNSWAVGSAYVELQQKARTSMDKMVSELNVSSSKVAVIYACGAPDICSGSAIIFKVPVADSGHIYDSEGNVKWGADNSLDYEITYFARQNQLLRRITQTSPGACCKGEECFYISQAACGYMEGDFKGTGTNCTNPAICNPSPPTCFLASTPILMADGKTLPIEKLKKGDEIMAFDEETKTLVKDKVKEFFVHSADSYLIINNRLRVTPNHPVYSNGKWVEIGKLKKGDTLFNSQGKTEIIKEIKPVHQKVQVYNIEVNPYHNYFADGILAHNKEEYQYQEEGGGGGQPCPPICKLFRNIFDLASAFADEIISTQVMATNVAQVVFTGRDKDGAVVSNPSIVEIELTMQKTVTARQVEVRVKSSVVLKN